MHLPPPTLSELASPGGLENGFETAKSAIADMTKLAPSEIKSDVVALSAGFTKLSDVFAKHDYDSKKLAAAAASDSTLLDTITSVSEGQLQRRFRPTECLRREGVRPPARIIVRF